MALFGDSKEEKKAAELSEHISRNVAGTIAESIKLCMEPVFVELAGTIRASLAESTELQKQTTEKMAAEFLSQLKQQTGEVYGALNAEAASMVEAIKAEAASLTEAQKESTATFKNVQDNLTAGINKLNEISAEQKQMMEELHAAEQKRSAEYNEVLSKMQSTLTEINATYEKIVAGTAKNIEEQNNAVSESLKAQSASVAEALKAQSTSTTEALKAQSTSTTEALKAQSAAATEALQAQNNNLAEMLANQNNTLTETKQLVSDLAKSMEGLKSGWVDKYISCDEALSKNAAALLENIEKSNRAMACSTEAFDKAASVMQSGLASIEEKLVTSRKNYEAGIEQNVSKILEVMDHQIAGIATTLGKTAEDISEAAEKIPKALRGIVQ